MSRTFFAASAAMVIGLSAQAHGALEGSATLTPTPGGGGSTQWSVVLNNTGTTTIGTLWFAWVPGQNYLSANPAAITSPAGWTASVTTGGGGDGWGIRWTASSAAARLPAGGLLGGFGFTASINAAQMAGFSPAHPSALMTTSFVYSGGAFSDAGFQFAGTVVPSPAAAALAGPMGLAALRRRRRGG